MSSLQMMKQGVIMQKEKKNIEFLDYIYHKTNETQPYMNIGRWIDYNELELTFLCNDTNGRDIFFGRDSTGYIGYTSNSEGATMTTIAVPSGSNVSVVPNLTREEKGDGTKRVVNIFYTSSNSSKVLTYGAYGSSYNVRRNAYGLKLKKNGVVIYDLKPARLLKDFGEYSAGAVGFFDEEKQKFFGSADKNYNFFTDE